MKIFNKSLLAIGLLAFGSLSQAAIVNSWTANVYGEWTNYAPAGVTLINDQTLAWGTPSPSPGPQSSLVINNPGNVTVTTYVGGGSDPLPGAPYTTPSISLTHNNKVITAGSASLKDATLKLTVTLSPSPDVGPLLVDYDIRFLETANQTPCVATSPAGIPCNDIFGLVDGFLNTSFVYQEQTYYLNAFPIENGSLKNLKPAECIAVGLLAGCQGFTTQEKKSTELPFGFMISTAPIDNNVPEPGSLALIGLALAGMGAVSRRRSAKQTKA